MELAQLKYQAAHLVQSGAAGRDSGYDRQGGGTGAMGGAGEKALEIQRRQLRDRTAEVGKLLAEVEKRRAVQRRTRDRRREPTVALVGYTNVGKSSLLNRLSLGGKGGGGSGAGKGRSGGVRGKGAVHSQDRVFDTLDPTSRSITLPSLARWVRFRSGAVRLGSFSSVCEGEIERLLRCTALHCVALRCAALHCVSYTVLHRPVHALFYYGEGSGRAGG